MTLMQELPCFIFSGTIYRDFTDTISLKSELFLFLMLQCPNLYLECVRLPFLHSLANTLYNITILCFAFAKKIGSLLLHSINLISRMMKYFFMSLKSHFCFYKEWLIHLFCLFFSFLSIFLLDVHYLCPFILYWYQFLIGIWQGIWLLPNFVHDALLWTTTLSYVARQIHPYFYLTVWAFLSIS